jgi:DNA-binding response OmpR family regulator
MAKILIVEDDKFLRELMVEKLKSAGFQIVEAVDGEKGIEEAQKEIPDLILLDLILPGINGFEVLSQIKAAATTANIPVIILSNLGAEEDIEKGNSLGASGYLVKAQFTPSEIIEKVNQILAKS